MRLDEKDIDALAGELKELNHSDTSVSDQHIEYCILKLKVKAFRRRLFWRLREYGLFWRLRRRSDHIVGYHFSN